MNRIKQFISRWRGERGITGLETAIILIAFVVVASVFAFVVLSTVPSSGSTYHLFSAFPWVTPLSSDII